MKTKKGAGMINKFRADGESEDTIAQVKIDETKEEPKPANGRKLYTY